jgi:hypothetical protein
MFIYLCGLRVICGEFLGTQRAKARIAALYERDSFATTLE